MTWKTVLAASCAAAALAAWSPQIGIRPAFAACMAGDHIDSSTPRQAARKMVQAGYTGVHDLRKGCDNYWHALAMRSGKTDQVVLSPAGKVQLEGLSRIAATDPAALHRMEQSARLR